MSTQNVSTSKLMLPALMAATELALSGCMGHAGKPPAASAESAVNSRTMRVSVGDRQFAYRSIGSGSPVLFLQRFRGTMDDWDPAFVDAVATNHRAILFDNSGVATSTGEVATTLEAA